MKRIEKITVTLISIQRSIFSSSSNQQTEDLPSQSSATKALEAAEALDFFWSSVQRIWRHRSGSRGSSSSCVSKSLKSDETEGDGTGVRAKIALIRLEPTRRIGVPESLD